MKRKSILFIVPRFGTLFRGVEVFAEKLALRLSTSFDITILSGDNGLHLHNVNNAKRRLWRRENINTLVGKYVRYLPRRFGLNNVELEALTLMINSRLFLAQNKFDYILPFGGTWTFRYAHKFRKGAQIVNIGHAGPVMFDLTLSDVFIALTPTDKDLANMLKPAIRSHLIPNGVDTLDFSLLEGKATGRAFRTVLCVGALTPEKRIDLLFDAVLNLDKSVRVVCVGQGPLQKELSQHQLCQQGQVEFIVEKHEDMPNIYRNADVFTLPSPGETFGLVFLEALSTGLPVVAHDAPRQRYVVGDTGIFCNVYDRDSYSKAIEIGLDAPVDRARRLHAEKFDWNKIECQYRNLFCSL